MALYKNLGVSAAGVCRRVLLTTDSLPLKQIRGCKALLRQTSFAFDPLSTSFHTGTSRLHEEKNVEKQEESNQIHQPKNFVQSLFNKVFAGQIPKAKLKACGYILETHCSQAIDVKEFMEAFDMPDTFYSWFLITELHIWILGARLMKEGDAGRLVRNSMVEALWTDCENRAKAIGDLASSLRSKYIAEISEQFQASLFVYDEGILGNDIQLANALWRRFFLSMREVEEGSGEEHMPDPEKLELLVRYVRRTASYLDSKDAADIIVRQQISWPKVLDV